MTRAYFFILSCLVSSPSVLLGQGVADYLADGEQFARRSDHQRALEAYKEAYETDSTNCTVLWRMAEAYVNLGEEAGKDLKRQYFYTAEKWARKAVTQCPDTANAHFFVAVAAGRLALLEGGKQRINRSKVVKAEAERTIELDPRHHGAYHVLGRWHVEVASLSWFLKAAAKIVYGGVPPGASYEAAVENFKKAIEISPNWINHHRQLGEVYMKMKEWERAKREFERVLELPEIDHEDIIHKQQSRRFLEKIKDK